MPENARLHSGHNLERFRGASHAVWVSSAFTNALENGPTAVESLFRCLLYSLALFFHLLGDPPTLSLFLTATDYGQRHQHHASAIGTTIVSGLEPSMNSAGDVYRQLGVEPLINCAGVRTNFGGSSPLPAVRRAMEAAADAFVDLDELADAIAARIQELTGAEWGVITAGSAAALALAAAACIAGNDPEHILSLPEFEPRPLILMPGTHRFAYDQSLRMSGAIIAEFHSLSELRAQVQSGAAMICVLGRRSVSEFGGLEGIAAEAAMTKIPILVDCAGMGPSSPDVWLQRGASMVVYSAGKYLRGPQSTAFLVGSKALTKAAWQIGAPHQAWGRPIKVGKEEMIGAIVALEQWFSDPDACQEQQRWLRALDFIAFPIARLPGVRTTVIPADEFNVVPRLRIDIDEDKYHVEPSKFRSDLLAERPRVLLNDFWVRPDHIIVDPFNIEEGEAELAATKIVAALRGCLGRPRQYAGTSPVCDFGGSWSTTISFAHRDEESILRLSGDDAGIIEGTHHTQRGIGVVNGIAIGNTLSLHAAHQHDSMRVLYSFEGSLVNDEISGTVVLGASSEEHRGMVFDSQFGTSLWKGKRSDE
ncbi:hypothetical protein ACFHWW_04705 [Ensifer sp. P24N7]|uniref:hypothetical protein n=1 Tax=Sinorhizobium sp. P24N7 TaxID=3348358 RepID=UPI0035F2E6F0